jgi:hypothetical protein
MLLLDEILQALTGKYPRLGVHNRQGKAHRGSCPSGRFSLVRQCLDTARAQSLI